jgi:hypothetical protein
MERPPPAYKRQHLVRRQACRIQETYYGGLEERTQQHLAELAETDALALVTGKPKKKTPGTQLVPGTRTCAARNTISHNTNRKEQHQC